MSLSPKEKILKKTLNELWGAGTVALTLTDEYKNMECIIKEHMYLIDYARQACANANVPEDISPIRGGTDGCKLSFKAVILSRKTGRNLAFLCNAFQKEIGVSPPLSKFVIESALPPLYGISCAFSTGSALSSVETLVSTGGALWALPSSSSTSDASIQFSVT